MTSEPRPVTFVLTLQPLPGVVDPVKALRWILKTVLRRHGMRCVHVCEENDGGPSRSTMTAIDEVLRGYCDAQQRIFAAHRGE